MTELYHGGTYMIALVLEYRDMNYTRSPMNHPYMLAGVAILFAGTIMCADTQETKRKPLVGSLQVGDAAPDFTIKDIDDKESTTLSKLQGKPVVLIFGSCT